MRRLSREMHLGVKLRNGGVKVVTVCTIPRISKDVPLGSVSSRGVLSDLGDTVLQ